MWNVYRTEDAYWSGYVGEEYSSDPSLLQEGKNIFRHTVDIDVTDRERPTGMLRDERGLAPGFRYSIPYVVKLERKLIGSFDTAQEAWAFVEQRSPAHAERVRQDIKNRRKSGGIRFVLEDLKVSEAEASEQNEFRI